jgi:penicillin amidase
VRRLITGAVALSLFVGVLAIAAVVYVRSALPIREGRIEVPGLERPIDVLWTNRAVPHVRASSMEDAVFAQGFLHARDRLWQMDLVRRAVQGRLAEIMGEPALEADRFMRRLGIWDAARASLSTLSDRELALIQAYADGVNAALEVRTGALPPEFLVLRYEPEPWEPAHTFAVAKMMSLTLAAYGESVAVARALRRLDPDRVRWLFPEFPEGGTTILPAGSPEQTAPGVPGERASSAGPRAGAPFNARPSPEPAAGPPPEPAPGSSPEPPDPPALAAALIDRFSIATGSNSWVLDGSLTRSGRPMLANDMHLDLQAPALWYLVGLHAPAPSDTAPALDVVGVSIPGAPFVIAGRNRAISWGLTNAYVDDVDIFLERLDPADPGRYMTPDGSHPFEVVAESIRVRGADDPVVMEVRRTRHGPVLPQETSDTLLALQWTAFEPTTVFRAVMGFNLARSWEEFLDAADSMDDPHQNLVYGDTAGHIGYVMGGTVPIRGNRRPAPVAPRPGWTGEWDWQGELPFDEHPRVLDPPAGFIVTANNRQTTGPVSRLVSRTWLQPFRAARITELIREGRPPYGPGDLLAMQMDVVDLYAERYVDRAVEAARSAGFDDIAAELEAWDRRADGESRAAPIFYAWSELVRRGLARHLFGGEAPYFTRESATAVLDRRSVPWADDPGAAYREIARAAMRRAAVLARGRSWAESNRVVHSHPLGDVAMLDRILGLDIGPSPHHGAPTTVNVALWAFQTPSDDFPFTTTAGPSMRQVVDMGNTDAAGGFVIPTGQSGIPFSRHYDDQTELWRWGGLLDLPMHGEAIDAAAERKLRLDPIEDD